VGFLHFKKMHVEQKELNESGQCLKNHTSGLESLDKLQIQMM